ncbi:MULTISPECIES: hypothetical protein [Pandoraea]|uniref:hypothetical protein n=1 Tax=Pandoraea TaxID=93217 RepID=UPI0008464A02|nr:MULTISPECIES: hypothetical protein [Pandoraea]MCI3204606.1 hypothetical protein [Pandoraea sp. LA3]MDN4582634.1 hypothetical protein [Pandoraea capi]ODP30908.1 hypothetical protein A9762_27585 [Pandoraea sp. ISTKB]ODP31424.1 hypothetical protein A9762_26345 [Pandoraea sp. ISTKB]
MSYASHEQVYDYRAGYRIRVRAFQNEYAGPWDYLVQVLKHDKPEGPEVRSPDGHRDNRLDAEMAGRKAGERIVDELLGDGDA